ncbi:MAG: hypothetical protein EA424_15720 [Planctomycetaceae bacterium]|nr:MAG: hypothetical protein EA424_15720 [Planctomycetaceae bacterium]
MTTDQHGQIRLLGHHFDQQATFRILAAPADERGGSERPKDQPLRLSIKGSTLALEVLQDLGRKGSGQHANLSPLAAIQSDEIQRCILTQRRELSHGLESYQIRQFFVGDRRNLQHTQFRATAWNGDQPIVLPQAALLDRLGQLRL